MNALAYSIVTASVAGLLTGFAMKPGDALADRPIGPQILISGANNRVIDNDGWYADTQLANYNGQVPEYVLGTDWTQPRTYETAYSETTPAPITVETAAADPDDFAAPLDTPEQPRVTRAHLPSEDGDILAGVHDDGPQVIHISATDDDAQAS
ncbi:MAG: hypothetical protein ACM3W4_05480 [Ignavibacteriales bacterium]